MRRPAAMRQLGVLWAGGLLAAGALTVALLTGFQKDSLGSINGMLLDRREFVLLASQERAQTAQYFRNKYGADVNESFWMNEYDGMKPADYAKRAALDRLIEYKLEQQLALSYGIKVPANYGQFLQHLKEENERRKEALRIGSPIYGPVQYNEWSYYDYVHSTMLIELKRKLMEGEGTVTDEEMRKAYEQRKERYRLPRHVSVNVLYLPAEQESLAARAVSSLTSGVSFGEVRSGLSAHLVKRYPDGEGIKLGDSGSEDATEAEERLLDVTLKLQPGEASRVRWADGFAVIQLNDKSVPGYVPLDDVKEAVRNELADQWFERHIEQLKSQAMIELDETIYQSVKLEK